MFVAVLVVEFGDFEAGFWLHDNVQKPRRLHLALLILNFLSIIH